MVEQDQFNLFNFRNNLFAKNLIKAQKDWLEILQEKGNDTIINDNNNWFKDVETEVKEVIEFGNKVLISNTIGENNNSDDYDKGYSKSKENILKWFIERNNILHAWFVFDKMYTVFMISLLIFVLYPVISIIIKVNSFKQCPYWFSLNNKAGLFIVFIILFLFTIISLIPLEKITEKSYKKYIEWLKKAPMLLLKLWMIPLWILIIGSSIIVMEVTSFYNKNFIFNDWTFYLGILILFSLIMIIFIKFIIAFINNKGVKIINKYAKRKENKDEIKKWICINKTWLSIVASIFISSILFLIWNLCIQPLPHFRWLLIIPVFFILFVLIFFILYNNEKEKHSMLSTTTSLNKTLSMYFYGIVISLIVNLFIYNMYYKEYLEQYEYLGQIWHHTELEETVLEEIHKEDSLKGNNAHNPHGKESITNESHNAKLHKSDCAYIPKNKTHTSHEKLQYIYSNSVSSTNYYNKVKRVANMPLSDSVNVFINDMFFDQLRYVSVSEVCEGKIKKIHPILKEININGFTFISIPSVLYINTLLSLLVAVILQIILHKRKFLLGGEAE